MISDTKTRVRMAPRSGPAERQMGTPRPSAAPTRAGAEVRAGARSEASEPLPAAAEGQPHLAEALRAADAARAAAALIRAGIATESAPVAAQQPDPAAAASRSTWRGLSVAEAAAAATISFRPLCRPYGRLPHGAPNRDLKPIERCATAHDPPRPEPPVVPRRFARTIAELERLRRTARLPSQQARLLPMSGRT